MNIVNYRGNITDVNLGGKANSLLQLSQDGINVPEFFVITSALYREFLSDSNLEEIVTGKDYKKIQRSIDGASFSTKLANEILNKYDELGLNLVSVRSSASNEDGVEKSFAGQYETFLDVNRDQLLEKVKDC